MLSGGQSTATRGTSFVAAGRAVSSSEKIHEGVTSYKSVYSRRAFAVSSLIKMMVPRRRSDARTHRRQQKGAPPYDTSERPRGGLRLRLQSVAKAKPPGIEAVSSTSVANRTGSIGQYGAESQVAREIRAKQDSGASLATTGGRDESERVDPGWAGSEGGSLGALGEGVGGRRYASTSLLPSPACQSPRRERRGPGILKDRQ